MNYIYDLILNFKEEYYDFYDWNSKDALTHIRKIPIFKVTTKTMYDFLNYDILLKKTFLDEIESKSEIFIGRRVKKEKYTFLLTDSRKVIAVKIKDNKMFLSDLLLYEEEETMEILPILSLTEIEYEIIKEHKKQKLKTRKEIEFEKYLEKELQNLMKKEHEEKLKYIYYECFDKREESKENIIVDMKRELKQNFHTFSKKLDYLLKIT